MVEKELAASPRRGLLAKCKALSYGDVNRAKARYMQVWVKEMQEQMAEEAVRKAEAEEGKPSYGLRLLKAALTRDAHRMARRWKN